MGENYKILIIDDEKPARDLIRAYLSSFQNITITGEASNGFEALKKIQEHTPDLIFLDIQMPKISGIELLEVLDDPPSVIFTTAYDDYAIKAFELNAIDYLLKPFSEERFMQAVTKVLEAQENTSPKKNQNLVENPSTPNYDVPNRVVVKKGSDLIMIPTCEILYIEASDDYVFIHTKENKYIKNSTLKHFQTHLHTDQFIRIHRSYLVNVSKISKIEKYEKDSHVAIIDNIHKLKVSKSGYKGLKEILNI